MVINDHNINFVWAAVGAVLALPGAMFIAWATIPRQRLASVTAAFIGGVLGYFVTIFVWQVPLNHTHLEGAVMLASTFFIASVTALIAALLVNSLLTGSSKPTRSTQVEY